MLSKSSELRRLDFKQVATDYALGLAVVRGRGRCIEAWHAAMPNGADRQQREGADEDRSSDVTRDSATRQMALRRRRNASRCRIGRAEIATRSAVPRASLPAHHSGS